MGDREELMELRRLEELEARAAAASSPQPVASAKPQEASLTDRALGSGVGRTLLGMATPVLGIGQAAAHLTDPLTGLELGPKADAALKEIEASKRRGMERAGENIDVAGVVGQGIGALAPSTAVTKVLGHGAGPISRALVSGAQGAAVAGATPTKGEDFGTEKTSQMVTGGALGGLFSLGSNVVRGGAKVIRDVVRPLTEKGRATILDLFQQARVPEEARAKVAEALRTGKAIVPGSKPTAGEMVAHVPEATSLASHQRVLEKMSHPVATAPGFAARRAEQEAARLGQVQSFAKTPADLDAALQLRKDKAGELYTKAYQQVVKDRLPAEIGKNPYVKDAMGDALKLSEANQVNPKNNITQFGHYLKISLDKQLAKTGDGALHETEKRAVQGAKEKLVDWLVKKNPTYGQARDTFRDLSKDPNQMQVGQVLEEALRSPLGTKERSTVFANALANAPRTIKKATGQAVTDDLGKVLTPENMQKVNAVKADLARYDQYRNLARQSSAGGADTIPGNVEASLPNILSRPAMIANFVMKKIGESAEDKIAKEAAQRYLNNPEAIARALMRDPNMAGKYQQIIESLMRQAPVAAGVAGGQIGR